MVATSLRRSRTSPFASRVSKYNLFTSVLTALESTFRSRCRAGHKVMVALCTLILIAAVAVPARAQSCTVNATTDSGATGDILDCVNQANAGNSTTFTITFDPSLNGQTITLTSTLLLNAGGGITTNIQGPGANQLTISGGNAVQVFSIASGTVNISGLTITNGATANTGGGILNVSTVTVSNCSFVGNVGGAGGAIANEGTLTVTGSTFNGNTAGVGGAIAAAESSTTTILNSTFNGNTGNAEGGALLLEGTAAVSNSTISGNAAGLYGGGIFDGGTLTLVDSIVAGNTTGLTPGDDCDGCGQPPSNLIGTPYAQFNPGLAALGNYGGPTQTMLPLPGSLAFCAGTATLPSPLTLPPTDQRGFPRTNTTYSGFNTNNPCVDVGATQTNYQSIQFANSGGAYFVQSGDFFGQFGVTPPSSPAPIVSVTENGQNLGSVPITLTYTAPPGTPGGAIFGLGPVTTVAGTGATFSNLFSYFPGSYTLAASLTLFTPSGGQPVSITTNPIASLTVQGQPTIISLSQLGSFIVGSPFGFNGTISPNPPSFTLPNGSGILTIYNGTTPIAEGAVKVLGFGPNSFGIQVNNTYLPPGIYPITVVFNGGLPLYASSSATGSLTIAQDNVNISVGSSSNPSTYGQPITLTATVAAAPYTGLQPSGAVQFTDTTTNTSLGISGLTPISGINGSGQASITLPNGLSTGTHQIQAVYLGDVNFKTQGLVVSQVVNPAADSVTFTMQAPPSAEYGSSFTVAASGLGTGAITYTSDGVVCTNAGALYTMIAGSGMCTMTATQAADTNYLSGSASESVTGIPANSSVSVSLTSGTNPSLSGQPVTFTAIITSDTGLLRRQTRRKRRAGPDDVGGIVTWSANTGCKASKIAGYPGTATCTTSILPVGSDTVTATYSGDANHNGASGSTALDVALPTTVQVSPASLSFGNQAVDTKSAGKAVTLTNTGSATLYVTSTATSGDFGISTSACSILPPGKRCKIEIYFSPTRPGARAGTLSFTDNSANSPQMVPLSGTGIENAKLTPAGATFLPQTVGVSSPPKTFTLTNEDPAPLTNIQITTSGDFAVVATSCGGSLAANAKCWISVTFTPTATGTRTGQLSVSDSANNSPQTSNLTGTGK